MSAVSAQLPKNASQRSTGVPGLLQELHSGFGSMMTQPLTLGSVVPSLMATQAMSRIAAPPADELDGWLDAACRVEAAHRRTVAWYRSRLPSYPFIFAPQLARGTPLTTLEWTNQLIWAPDERRRGLQLQDMPPDVGHELAVTRAKGQELAESGRVVASHLEDTDEWKAFREADQALDQLGKADLRAARRRLARLLAPEAVDTHEPKFAMPRGEYRAQMTFDVVESLNGCARAYADAFAAANALIDTTTSEVFGQLALHGEPITLAATKLDLHGGTPARVEFEIDDAHAFVLDCGNLAWLDDPLVSDVVRVESISMNVDIAIGARLKVGGSILDNTGDAWKAL